MSRFEYKDGFVFDDGVRMGMLDVVDVLNFATDKITELEQPAQQKNVADAYEELDSEDIEGHWEQVRYAPKQDCFFVDIKRSQWVDSVFVCTREQFEAYAKEQEGKQEGEKWTHADSDGNECKILHTIGEHSWVTYKNKSYEDELWPNVELREIKPKLTKAEAFTKICDIVDDCGDAKFAYDKVIEEYKII